MSNTELINAYFDNELSPSEMKMFEDRLTRDTELQREFKFQEDIIEGIRDARRQSLKARLDQVQVGGTAGSGSSWTAGKIAGMIGLAAIVGFGIYYFYPEDTTVSSETPVVTDQPAREEDESAHSEVATENTDEPSPMQETPSETQEPRDTSDEPVEQTTETARDETPAVETREENKNPVVAPSFDDPREEDTDVDLPEGEISGKAIINSGNLEVAVDNNSRRYDFHFRLEDDRLTLYGNFENDLYQILEFNTNEMNAWFLSYDNEFYRLEPTGGKVEPLEKVTDNALLQTLREAAKN